MRVLCINAGSSSVKVALYEVESAEEDEANSCSAQHAAAAAVSASDDGEGGSDSNLPPGVTLVVSKSLKQDEDPSATLRHFVEQQEREEEEHHAKLKKEPQIGGSAAAASASSSSAAAICAPGHPHPIRLVVHRIVHGGTLFSAPTVLTAENITKLETLNDLAPLHNPPALKWICAADKALCHPADGNGKEVRQVAIFDTSFFHELPPVSQAYALPLELLKKHHIRRYGFHGLAHEDMLRVLSEQRSKQRSATDSTPVLRGGRLVSLQLGSGCSATAVLCGQPQDTSMGFSPLEGLMMATRSGDVDAAVLAYLQSREPNLAAMNGGRPKALEEMLYYRSGMLGLSGGLSNDMRVLEKAAASGGHKEAQLTLDLFHHRVVQRIGAYVATLGGLDSLAFGGGIGEHSAPVRQAVVEQLAKFLPVRLDAAANEKASKAKGHTRISTPDSAVEVWVVKVDEAAIMLRDALTLTQPRGQQSQL